jgi:hypothetical protein
VTAALPARRSESDLALRAVGPKALFDVIDLSQPDATDRLDAYASGQRFPLEGFWSATDLADF